jgi:Cys-rich repeat protein
MSPKVGRGGGWVALLVAALALSGCPRDRTRGTGCSEDQHCGSPASAYRCDAQTGSCYCRTNDACLPKQFCNTAGFCQDKSGCEKNTDCLDPNLFCDTGTGTCLSKGRCTSDLHCPLGQVCDTARTTCVDGCRTNGDCPGVSCRCGTGPCGCTATTQVELAACPIGACDPTFCADDTFCPFGEICGQEPDAGVEQNQCYSDYDPVRRPYCDNCTFGGATEVCGRGPNFCLIDTTHGGNFCGADCSEGQACPRGYRCSDVVVVFRQWECSASKGCAPNPNFPCATDEECPRGGVCAKAPGQPNGHCAARCSIDEGDSIGYCSCLEDADCAQESCSAGECSITRRPCVDSTDCRPIRCVDFRGAGGCLVGQNCAPAEGLTCLEVR